MPVCRVGRRTRDLVHTRTLAADRRRAIDRSYAPLGDETRKGGRSFTVAQAVRRELPQQASFGRRGLKASQSGLGRRSHSWHGLRPVMLPVLPVEVKGKLKPGLQVGLGSPT